ncbi:Na+/H+ and K+/H+ antiporters [Thiohalobacter thiocyanaticus]|uniref:Na+/H+ and K+/H+ antiporters n=1 Tax=Thiohalobacter thiocyanaticus TaxID=585455 RepID=A0A1Z4VR00_9GAMM|nr:Na+/H+ and K+/H+ antiporters [Thiohalobacter thiocyanaticus]
MAKVRMVDSLKVDAVGAADGAGSLYRFIRCPIPAPGAAQHFAGEPQPDRAAVLAGGLFGVVLRAFVLIHFPALHK